MRNAADNLEELLGEIRALSPEKRSEVVEFVRRARTADTTAPDDQWGTFALDQWEPGPDGEVVYSLGDAREVYPRVH